jgi:hypothetical protein
MPALAIPFVASALVTVGVSVAVATFVSTVFVYAASAVLLNAASKALAPKRKAGGNAGVSSGLEVNYFDTEASIRIIYGSIRIGGMETLPAFCIGVNNERLQKLITIAGHRVASYQLTYFDDQLVTNGAISPNSGSNANTDGLVVSGTFSGHAWIRLYDGQSKAPYFDAMLAVASKQALATDIATAAVALKFNQSVYKSPPLLTFLISGRIAYDPRFDSPAGASPSNPGLAAYTSNPALALADYLIQPFGGSYESTDIDWDSVVTAANYCDVNVAIPPGAIQKRYTINGAISAADDFIDNVKVLANAMLGKIIYRDGKWRMYAGSWQTPTFTIASTDWISGLSIKFEQGRQKKFNRAACWYIDRLRNYQKEKSMAVTDTSLLAQAGGEVFDSETEQILCTDEYEAQRKSRLLLRQSNNQIIITGTLPPRFQNIAIWDTGTITMETLGWSSKTFRCINFNLKPTGDIEVTFAEEQSSDWDDPAEGDYNTPTIPAFVASTPTIPTGPSTFSVGDQINGTILFQLGEPIIKPLGTLFQIIRSTSSIDASVGTVMWEGAAKVVAMVVPTSPHFYYARCIANSIVSEYTPNTFGLIARAKPTASYKFDSDLVSDPEILYSSEMGQYWTTIRTDIYSLSLSGGSVGGRIITKAGSYGFVGFDMANNLISLTNSPYPRYMVGRSAYIAIRYRPLTAISPSSSAPGVLRYVHRLELYAWSGVGTPADANSNIFPLNGTQILVNSNGQMPNSGSYVDFTGSLGLFSVSTLLASFPYIVATLRPNYTNNTDSFMQKASSLDMFEFDAIFVKLL